MKTRSLDAAITQQLPALGAPIATAGPRPPQIRRWMVVFGLASWRLRAFLGLGWRARSRRVTHG